MGVNMWAWGPAAGTHAAPDNFPTAAQVREDEAGDLARGTRITLHLKEDAVELADAAKLGSLIKQYSEFIQFPIRLWGPKTEFEQVALQSLLFNI